MKLAMRAQSAYKKVTLMATAFVLAVSSLTAAAPFIFFQNASAIASPYSQGFEWGSSDWSNTTIVGDNADGFVSSEGTHYARASQGAFTTWGQDRARSNFPVGGYSTSLDMYLKMDTANGGADKRVDYSSAINDRAGVHKRDFIFHFATDPNVANQWFVSVSNNAPGNPVASASKVAVSQDGWYSLTQDFKNVDGVLAVTMNIVNKSSGAVVGTWTLSDPSDVIESNVGGARYGWFTTQRFDIPYVAIDNAKLTVYNAPQPTAPQNGAVQYTNSSAIFGWNEVNGAQSYEVLYSKGPSRTPNNNDGQLNDALGTATTESNSTTVNNLPGGTLFWQVRGMFNGVAGPWSNIWTTNIANSTNVIVTAQDNHGWEFNGDRATGWTRGESGYVTGPQATPLGEGSVQITADSSTDREKIRKYVDAGIKLSDITDLTYSTYRTSDSTGTATALALQIDVNFNNTPVNSLKADARVVFDPYMVTGTVLNDTWQTWNTLSQKGWFITGLSQTICAQDSPCTWAQMLASYPSIQTSAKSLENTIDTQAAVQFKAGGWPNITKFDGNVDAFVFGIRQDGVINRTTYDFERDTTPPTVPTAAFTQASDSTPVASGGSTNSEYFTFNLNSSSDVARYQVKYWNNISTSGFNENSPWVEDDLSGYSSSLGVYNDRFTQGEGTHYFAFSACDSAGNCTPFGQPFVVTYDKTAPSVTVNSASYLTTDTAQTITGTADANSIVSLFVGDMNTPVASNIQPDNNGNWTYTLPTPREAGSYNVAVNAEDAAGNRSAIGTAGSTAIFVVTAPNTTNPDPDPGPGTPVVSIPQPNPETEEEDAFGTLIPGQIVFPATINPGAFAQVLGDSTTNNEADNANQGTPEVEGVSTQNNVAQAVDSDANQGRFMGMAWYWWLLIIAAIIGLIWWIVAAVRRRNAEQN